MFCGECQHQRPSDKCPIKAPDCADPPPPPPPVGACTLGTPKASETPSAQIVVQRISKMIVGSTPKGCFGKEYYASAEMNWPEAAAAGRTCGPVAREGHPQRVACEAQFMEQPCPTYSTTQALGHISFDPWFVIDGVNQNHPKNVAAGCGKQFEDHESWIKEGQYIQSGMWLRATVHGDTKVMACMSNGTICGVSKFRVDN